MTEIVFKPNEPIAEDWLRYIESEAFALSINTDYDIEHYSDSELLNPEVQAFLYNDFEITDHDLENAGLVSAFDEDLKDDSYLALSVTQNRALAGKPLLFNYWKRLKMTVQKVFLSVIQPHAEQNKIGWKGILQESIDALLTVFVKGVPAVVLPILTSSVASAMKLGYFKISSSCI